MGFLFSMNKDAYYFPHFSNARTDRKLLRVRKELGIEGYGIYFMLLEVLRDTPEYKYPLEDIDLLANEFDTSEPKVRTVICNYKLFEVDENDCFFSLRFNEFLQPYLKMKEQRRTAGLASAAKRLLNDRSTTVQQSKVKESKEEESKVNEIISEIEIEKCLEIALRDERWSRSNQADQEQLTVFNTILEGQGVYYIEPIEYKRYFHNLKKKYPNKLMKDYTLEELKAMAAERDLKNKN
jgi:hypothetical protein